MAEVVPAHFDFGAGIAEGLGELLRAVLRDDAVVLSGEHEDRSTGDRKERFGDEREHGAQERCAGQEARDGAAGARRQC